MSFKLILFYNKVLLLVKSLQIFAINWFEILFFLALYLHVVAIYIYIFGDYRNKILTWLL